jgi:hypothetical protein
MYMAIILAAFACSRQTASLSQEPPAPLEIQINIPKSIATAGQPLELNLSLVNVSNEPIWICEGNGFLVFSGSNNDDIVWGTIDRRFGMGDGYGTYILLKPGERRKNTKYYDVPFGYTDKMFLKVIYESIHEGSRSDINTWF